jgi:hypothetical protein
MLRLFASVALVSAWLALLLLGWSLHGLVHLLLVAGVALFPWRTLGDDDAAG